MKKSFILTIVFLVLISVIKVYACDVNLFSLIAGNTKEKSFIEATTQLAVLSKTLNENVKSPDASQKLENLMNQWMTFTNTYLVFPPEWGKTDEKWKDKFDDLAQTLGEIRKYLGKDYPKTHKAIMKFSRRLSRLYEQMPNTSESSLLLDFTYGVDDLWVSFDKKDLDGIRKVVERLNSKYALLDETFKGRDNSGHIKNIEGRLDFLTEYSEPNKKLDGFAISVLINLLENDLAKLNEELSASLASSTTEIH
ncbi:MAG: hypothetical protein II567_16910 [Candidatus Riflebacteria bacterium]|nr:hypothetical protein [Candidatus Riflebacteria bacterium]